jgi:PncC family amidohydrolase
MGMADAGRILDFLKARGYTVAVAESFTGGLLADAFIRIPGASDVMLGGVVAYSNEAKKELLGVPAAILDGHGAVSAETAAAMAEGARRLFGADCAVSTTGIAGPTGATRDKPLGLCFASAVAPPGRHLAEDTFAGDRSAVRQSGVVQALGALAVALGMQDSVEHPSP